MQRRRYIRKTYMCEQQSAARKIRSSCVRTLDDQRTHHITQKENSAGHAPPSSIGIFYLFVVFFCCAAFLFTVFVGL